jgi:Mn-dependent DtxR family transcriptional regulator
MKKENITRPFLKRMVFENGGKQIIDVLIKTKLLSVNEISIKSKQKQSNASTILNTLYTIKIVNRQKKGKYVFYELNASFYKKVVKAYNQIETFEKSKIQELFKDVCTKEKDPFIYKQKSIK